MTTTVKTRKTCFKCKVEKVLTEFYVHPAMGDGRLNKCKECTKKDVSKNYRDNIDHYTAYERARRNLPHRLSARQQYARTPEGRAAAIRAHKKAIAEYPEKRAARVAVGNALRDGRLIRQPCEKCGTAKAEAHHDDYSKPLYVRWLCKKHHEEHHRQHDEQQVA